MYNFNKITNLLNKKYIRYITNEIKIPKYIKLNDFSKIVNLSPKYIASTICQRDNSNYFLTVFYFILIYIIG